MLKKRLKIGTRKSPLAIRQAEEAVGFLSSRYPAAEFELVGIETRGDRDRTTPISDVEGSDFFTREIDDALLKGGIDLAVHSAKDLADPIPDGLEVLAITKPIDPLDALVSKKNIKLDDLPYGARVGMSSQRRKEQLKTYRADFNIVDIRGTIGERLKKFNESDLDAIIVAAAALVRLGLDHKIAQKISPDILKPHPLQGALAVVIRKGDKRFGNT